MKQLLAWCLIGLACIYLVQAQVLLLLQIDSFPVQNFDFIRQLSYGPLHFLQGCQYGNSLLNGRQIGGYAFRNRSQGIFVYGQATLGDLLHIILYHLNDQWQTHRGYFPAPFCV